MRFDVELFFLFVFRLIRYSTSCPIDAPKASNKRCDLWTREHCKVLTTMSCLYSLFGNEITFLISQPQISQYPLPKRISRTRCLQMSNQISIGNLCFSKIKSWICVRLNFKLNSNLNWSAAQLIRVIYYPVENLAQKQRCNERNHTHSDLPIFHWISILKFHAKYSGRD